MAAMNSNELKAFRNEKFIYLFGDCSSFLEEEASLEDRGESLCDLQVSQSARGYRQAALVWSIRGWTVRYASGLQGRAIMRHATGFTPEDALEFAKEWAEQDPERREVIVRRHSVKWAEKDGHDQSAIHALDC
jgi:hypothetical protein